MVKLKIRNAYFASKSALSLTTLRYHSTSNSSRQVRNQGSISSLKAFDGSITINGGMPGKVNISNKPANNKYVIR
ncbi:MAG TPA: hypothetical protein PKL53_09855 [Methylotenera sp.]|nr:hypothetical protein [Methylotenera sp.]HPV44066.1 hypothetical protein [Methylotenera sp.]